MHANNKNFKFLYRPVSHWIPTPFYTIFSSFLVKHYSVESVHHRQLFCLPQAKYNTSAFT